MVDNNPSAIIDRLHELEGENRKLKIAEKMLFQVFNTIGFCKRIENNLPDVFDDQICDGIADYFNAS